jgi:hypothetical protein
MCFICLNVCLIYIELSMRLLFHEVALARPRMGVLQLGLGFLQHIVMAEELETYKYRYLGLIEGRKAKRRMRGSGCNVLFCCMT